MSPWQHTEMKPGWQPKPNTQRHTRRHPHTEYSSTHTHTCTHEQAHTNTVNISPLASANYELDSFVEKTHTSLNLAAFHTHTVSQQCKTQRQRTPQVKSQNIDWMIQLFRVVRLSLFFHIFCKHLAKSLHSDILPFSVEIILSMTAHIHCAWMITVQSPLRKPQYLIPIQQTA